MLSIGNVEEKYGWKDKLVNGTDLQNWESRETGYEGWDKK